MTKIGKPLAAFALCLLAAAPAPRGEGSKPAEDLESTRATLAKWMETQQVLARERQDWMLGKEVLEQRIDLLRGEVDALDGQIGRTREGITEADHKRQEMIDENGALKTASSSLEKSIGSLEGRTRELLARLPDPIRERVKPLSQRLPAVSAQAGLSLGERFQTVIGILNEINKFNMDITVVSELRDLGDGSKAEVKALYLGLGQAYYVTPKGDRAGVGRPGPDGWTWSPANEMAPRIAQAIAIFQNEQIPAFVPLPVEIQ